MKTEFYSLEELNINPNRIQHTTNKMEIAKAPKNVIEDIYNVLIDASKEQGKKSTSEEYENAISHVKLAKIEAKKRILEKEIKEDEQGFAVISLLMIIGLLGMTSFVFLTIKSLIH